MAAFSSRQFPILFRNSWTTSGLAQSIEGIDVDELCREYDAVMAAAPRRSDADQRYFVGHDGILRARNPESASEQHLAIALWRFKSLPTQPGVSRLRFLDYQFPLKASRSDAGLGEVDLLGTTERGRLTVIELKVQSRNNHRADTPVRALMEGLRYAAVIQANQGAIAREARDCFALDLSDEAPIVQILAPEDWWESWCDMPGPTRSDAGSWASAFLELAARLQNRLGITVECAALLNTGLADVEWDAHGPCIRKRPTVSPMVLDRGQASSGPVGYAAFDAALRERFWAWADQHHTNELDGGGRKGRPPVLRADFTTKAVLVPTDTARAQSVVSSLPNRERHRYFSSFNSSQALTQSVFGGVAAFGRLDLLDGVTSDCGRSAFLENNVGARLELEHQVQTLGEPRRTSVDVLLEAPIRRVAVECKFTEREFGVCSRPKLRPGDPTYARQHCDGNYRVQRDRRNRCALTEIGVRYWTFLPKLFEWNAERDLFPCPLSPVYQLARNALAATVTDAGFDPNSGHALVVYDARNPEFAPGGAARNQYDAIVASCRVPGLVRRVSWQRIAVSLAAAPELDYLMVGLDEKYGISPL